MAPKLPTTPTLQGRRTASQAGTPASTSPQGNGVGRSSAQRRFPFGPGGSGGSPPRAERALLLLAALLSPACTPIQTDHLLAWTRSDDGTYMIAPRDVPELDDATHMRGALGTVTHGGRIRNNPDGSGDYTGGVDLVVHADVQTIGGEQVAVPLDEDGLLLYTFYANLAAARTAVEAHGIDTTAIFPMAAAWNPAVSPLLEFAPADNAAYATGANVFMLLPDGDDRDVPVLANEGVIFHEFGHAILHLLMTHDPGAPPLVIDPAVESYYWQASLHEGFADTLATLLLDDPRFIDASLDLPLRHVDDDHAVVDDSMLPSTRMSTDLSQIADDPYPLGTVYASFAWDLREATDPDTALVIVLDAIARWAPQGASDMDGTVYLSCLLQAADDAGLGDAACASNEARFALLGVPCP